MLNLVWPNFNINIFPVFYTFWNIKNNRVHTLIVDLCWETPPQGVFLHYLEVHLLIYLFHSFHFELPPEPNQELEVAMHLLYKWNVWSLFIIDAASIRSIIQSHKYLLYFCLRLSLLSFISFLVIECSS